MASTIEGALYERLATDPGVRALLGTTYRQGPAIFTEAAPGDATVPYIVIAPPRDLVPFDTKTSLGYEEMRDIEVYVAAGGTVTLLTGLTRAVRRALHRRPLGFLGVAGVLTDVTRETDIPGDGTILARSLTVRAVYEEV